MFLGKVIPVGVFNICFLGKCFLRVPIAYVSWEGVCCEYLQHMFVGKVIPLEESNFNSRYTSICFLGRCFL